MTASKKNIGSDLVKVDAYENTAADYEEIPELDDAFFDRATTDIKEASRRGRPPIGMRSKQLVSLRLDPGIVEAFKATGTGWQTRMNDALAEAAKRLKSASA